MGASRQRSLRTDDSAMNWPLQVRPAQVGLTEIRSSQVGFTEVSPTQICAGQVHARQIHTPKVRPSQVGCRHDRRHEVNTAKIKTTQVCSGRDTPSEKCPQQNCAPQVRFQSNSYRSSQYLAG